MFSPSPASGDAQLRLPDEAATLAFGRRLAAVVRRGDFIALEGELGAGKTALARALISALPGPDGVEISEEVPSPTFTLLQVYERLPAAVWHFDLYRISQPEEIYELGFEEALAEGITLVEWPQRLGGAFQIESRLDLRFFFTADAEARQLELRGGAAWRDRLGALLHHG